MKIIYYLPVAKEFIDKWEYYKVDHQILKKISTELIICDNIFDLIKNLKNTNLIYSWWWHRSVLVLIIAKLFNIKTMITGAIHVLDYTAVSSFSKKSFLYKLFNIIGLKLCNYNLTISKDQYHQISNFFKIKNLKTVESSLQKNHLDELDDSKIIQRVKNKVKIFSTVIWHVRENYVRKGIYETIDALCELSNLDFTYYIIGKDGGSLDKLKLYISKTKISDKIIFIENASEKDKKNIFLKTDIYLQPSWCEGFGNAVLEAMSYGAVPLVSRFTAQPEVVGKYGIIVQFVEKLEISNAISSHLNNPKISFKDVIKFAHNNYSFENRLRKMKKIINGIEK